MPKLWGNKGEWSEIYVFLYLLATGKLHAADADLNKIDDVFYNILNIVRSEDIGSLEFVIKKDTSMVLVVNTTTNTTLAAVPMSDCWLMANHLYREIVAAHTSSFSEIDIENFLNHLGVDTLKAKSTDKADIHIRIHDINTGFEAVQGFSIKSRLGSASTLINAGKTTNFVYEVTGNIDDDVMHEFNTCSKFFRDRFNVLCINGCDIVYHSMENEIFENNLLLIDGDLPEICAEMLKAFFWGGVASVEQALYQVTAANPMDYNLRRGHPFYYYKFKKLLTECALGMLPSRAWNGTADATGGYIVVREDGEVLCYHLFNRNDFEDYLVKNTKFETASTGRHDFGYIFKQNDRYYLKLNLQIRFIK